MSHFRFLMSPKPSVWYGQFSCLRETQKEGRVEDRYQPASSPSSITLIRALRLLPLLFFSTSNLMFAFFFPALIYSFFFPFSSHQHKCPMIDWLTDWCLRVALELYALQSMSVVRQCAPCMETLWIGNVIFHHNTFIMPTASRGKDESLLKHPLKSHLKHF